MKFKVMNRLRKIMTANELKDIKSIKEEIIRTETALDDLTDMLEMVLGSIDADNIKQDVIDSLGERPVGSVELRYMMEENAGYRYGTWQLLEDTIETAKSFLYIYMRVN